MAVKTTAVRLLKDLGAEFGCKGDVYVNTEEQMKALAARVKKLKLSNAYEEIAHDVCTVENDVKSGVKKAENDAKSAETDVRTTVDGSKATAAKS